MLCVPSGYNDVKRKLTSLSMRIGRCVGGGNIAERYITDQELDVCVCV